MRNSKSLQNPLLFWSPTVIEHRWAEKPQDVPIWDYSRGYPDDNQPPDRGFDWNNEEETLRVLRQQLGKYSWTPAPAPKDPKAYPRLVPCTPSCFTPTGDLSGSNLVNEFAEITRTSFEEGKFSIDEADKTAKNRILEIQNTYGFLYNPQDEGRDRAALREWLFFSFWVSAHLEAMAVLQDCGYAVMVSHMQDRDKQWLKFYDYRPEKIKTSFGKHPNGEKGVIQSPESEAEATKFAGTPWRKLLGFTTGVTTEEKMREVTANNLIMGFSVFAEEFQNLLQVKDGRIEQISRVPIYSWLRWQLGLAWLNPNAKVKRCEECKGYFIAKKVDAKMCSSTCRKRKYDRTTARTNARA